MLDLEMGRYGFYVWGSYGVSALMIGALAVKVWLEARRARRALSETEPSS